MELTIRRVRFSDELDNKLRFLKSKTGITPNILCRVGFCMSLDEPGIPKSDSEDGTREINRYTLTGELDDIFAVLLAQRMIGDGLPLTESDEQFKAHMHRGIQLVSARVRSLPELLAAAPERQPL